MAYNFRKIEEKWQNYWKQNNTFHVPNVSNKEKFYVLDMFPYPSGAGLHVGHPLGYIASDIYSRYKRHKGFNVLHPQGYDSFGLPAEQYAIQTGQHPQKTTDENIRRYREQLDRMGFSFDWSREIRTSDKIYYKWTQWMFLLLFDSWYDSNSQKARPIKELINHFKNKGTAEIINTSINFSAEEWLKFDSHQKEEILQEFRIAYISEAFVNWCPKLGTVLANDEVIDGLSQRGGYEVIRKKMKQWSIRISSYSERLLKGLDKIDWPEPLKDMQKNWIGKSKGAMIKFKINSSSKSISVFSTRPDTIFGATFLTLAPENELVTELTTKENKKEVEDYINSSSKKSERDRISDVKSISGVFTGSYVIHPFTKKLLPIWISDYVISTYGTGAVMAVPCGDARDYAFAKHFNIEIVNVFKNVNIDNEAFESKEKVQITNSDFLNDLDFDSAFDMACLKLSEISSGNKTINYKLRDAVFSRQRYWGEPIPIYFKNDIPHPINLKYLPLELPDVKNYLPTENGDPPLGNALKWGWDTEKNKVVSKSKIDEKKVFRIELNTMPGWAGSSWYFNRYMDPHNDHTFASNDALKYWKEVDLYVGGSEHATGHLLYSRFWQMFLYDFKLVSTEVYAKKLVNQGMILGNSALIYREIDSGIFISSDSLDDEKIQKINVDINFINQNNELDLKQFIDWQPEYSEAKFKMKNEAFKVEREVQKMSKSKYNVVNPDDICDSYGADTLRLYEMFLGPIEQAKPWNTNGISGVFNFLNKVWKLFYDENNLIVVDSEPDNESLKILNQTIKKINHDIENFSFNTCVSSLMILVNKLTDKKCSSSKVLKPLSILLSPFAPHLAEELWFILGNQNSIIDEVFPEHDPNLLIEKEKNYPVSFNGKLKFQILLSNDLSKQEVEEIISNHDLTIKNLDGKSIKKIIFVPNKIINVVC
jgi:leucyl-tRNA synthetase